jgi:hypothetical protein
LIVGKSARTIDRSAAVAVELPLGFVARMRFGSPLGNPPPPPPPEPGFKYSPFCAVYVPTALPVMTICINCAGENGGSVAIATAGLLPWLIEAPDP